MKKILPYSLFLLFIFTLHLLNAKLKDFSSYDEPLAVFSSAHQPQELYLIDRKPDVLVFRLTPYGEGELLEIPFEDFNTPLVLNWPDSFRKHLEVKNSDAYDVSIDKLRPAIYSLMRFSDLPDTLLETAPPIEQYIHLLIRANDIQEATELLLSLDLGNADFSKQALNVVVLLFTEGHLKLSRQLLNKLFTQNQSEAFIYSVKLFAVVLRENGSSKEALFIYDNLLEFVKKSVERQEIQLWKAYTHLIAGDIKSAQNLLKKIPLEGLAPSLEMIRSIIDSKRKFNEGDYASALKIATRALTKADINGIWNFELLWIAGLSYEKLGNLKSARFIYEEIQLFYPNTPFAQSAVERMKQFSY